MLGMGGDGAGEKKLRKVIDETRAERGRDLQSQVKSKRKGAIQEASRENQGEKGRGWPFERKERHVQGEEHPGIAPPGHWPDTRPSQGRRQRQSLSTVLGRSCFPWDFRPKSAEKSQGPGTWRRRDRGLGRSQVCICGAHRGAAKEEIHWAMVVGAAVLQTHLKEIISAFTLHSPASRGQ